MSVRETPITRQGINEKYDDWLEHPLARQYFDYSDFANFGYRDEATRSQKEACENLMEKLLAVVPEKKGKILDVACGKGATTRHLLKYYPPDAVTGINISERQLEKARANAPDCDFRLMSATEMDFEDESFDAIICVEAAFHFDTREKFLREAWRILKPGGTIMLTDILSSLKTERSSKLLTEKNHIEDPEEYEELLTRVGFEHAQTIDATDECWVRWNENLVEWVHEKYLEGVLKKGQYRFFLFDRYVRAAAVRYYILAAARKPRSTGGTE